VAQKLIIGLTGGIGSGKSVAARLFTLYGIPVYDSDFYAKRLMQTDETVKNWLIENFGQEVFSPCHCGSSLQSLASDFKTVAGQVRNDSIKKLNTKYLSEKIFTSPENLQKINKIVHFTVMNDFKNWVENQNSKIVIMESAIIFEGGLEKYFDFTVGVFADENTRIHRVMQRSKLSRAEVEKRIAQQLTPAKIAEKVDFSIINNENSAIIPQVEKIAVELLKKID
jgi:dephospho-CoA kinase